MPRSTAWCLDATYRSLGVNVKLPKSRKDYPAYTLKLAKILKEKNIKMENRQDYSGEDVWKKGIYIYQNDALVAFISNLLADGQVITSGYGSKPINRVGGFYIITNAPLEKKLIFTPGGSNIVLPSLPRKVGLVH
jgi:hypothetical protein